MDEKYLLKEDISNCPFDLDTVTNTSSLPERSTSSPMYSTEDIDPVWTCRLPPPPGCLPVTSSDEPFNLEYDMSKLPPSVRTYVLLKGVTENEIYEFSGARVAYVDEKNHILIQATTQKSVNMAISLIVALIKEGFDSLLVQRTKTEVETEPGLESNIPTLVKENSQGETTTEPAKKPAVEEIQSQHFEMEYEINDLPLNVRTHILLRGVVENRVTSASGASVRTEGSYVVPQNKKYSKQKPLCVFIEGTCEESISLAKKTLDELKAEAFRLEESTIVRKVPVGMEEAPKAFGLINRLLGPDGVNLRYVEDQTGATVSLRGRRSGFIEHNTGQESEEPLHIRVEHKNKDAIENAEILVCSLVKSIQDKFTEFSTYQSHHFVYYDQTLPGVSGAQPYVDPPSKIGYESIPVQTTQVVYESAPVLNKAPTCFLVPKKPPSSPNILPASKSSHLPTSKDSPVPTPKNSPLSKFKDSPLPTSKDSPLPTLKNSPLPILKVSSLLTPKDSLLRTPKDSHLPTSKDSPVATPKSSPLPTPKNSPLPKFKDSPLPTPNDSPLPTPKNSPLPKSKESPLHTSKYSPLPTPKNSPLPKSKDSPLHTSKHSPFAAPKNSPLPIFKVSPLLTPKDSPLSTSKDSPFPIPKNSPLPIPKDPSLCTPMDLPLTTHKNPPLLTPQNLPSSTPKNSPLSLSQGVPPPLLGPPIRPPPPPMIPSSTVHPGVIIRTVPHQRLELTQKRLLELGKELKCQTGETLSTKSAMTPSLLKINNPVKKVKFAIITGTKKTVLPNTSGQTITNPAKTLGAKALHQYTEINEEFQTNIEKHLVKPDSKSGSDYSPTVQKAEVGMSPQPSVKQEDVLQASSIYKNRYSTHRPLNKKVKLGSTKDATQFIRLSGSARKRFKRLLAAGVKPDVARIVALESPNRKDSDKSTKKLVTINCGDSKSDGATSLTTQSTEAGVSPQLLSGKQEDVHLPSGNSSSTDFHPRLNDSSHLAKLAKTAKRRFNMLLDIGVKPDTARIAVLAFVDPASAKHPESSSQKSVIVPSKNYHRRAIDRKSISSHRGNLGQRTQDRRTLNRRTPDRRTSNRRTSNRETRDRRSRPLNNKNNDTRQGSFYSPVKNSTNKPPREKKKHHPAEAERTAAKKQLSTHIPSKEKNEDHPEDAVQIVEDVNSKRLHPKSGSSPAPGKRQPSDSTPEDVVKDKTFVKSQALLVESEQTIHKKANNQLSQVVESLDSALKVYVSSLPAGLETTQLAKVQLLLKHVVPSQSDERSTDEQRSQLLIVLQLIEKSMGNSSGGSQHQTPLLQTMQMLKKVLQTDDLQSTNSEYQASSAQPCVSSISSTEEKSSQLIQVAELLQKLLQSHVNNSEICERTRLLPVLQVMQQVTAKIRTVVLNEQKNQLLIVLDLMEKALQSQSVRNSPLPLQLLQTIEALKRVLQSNSISESSVAAITPSTPIANPEKIIQQIPQTPVRVSADRPSQLLQLLQLMVTAMQTHINTIGVGAQKSQLLQITQLLEHTVTTQGKNLEKEEQKTHLSMILQLLETALQSLEQHPTQLMQIMQLIKMKLNQAPPMMLEPHPTQLMQVIELIQKTLQTYANSMEMNKEKEQLFRVIHLLQQALASQQGVTASPEQQKQLIRFIQLVQQTLETQVFPLSTGSQPLQILQIMQLIQQTLNSAASPPISDQCQPVVQPFSVPLSQNQFSHIVQQYNRSVQNNPGINLPPQQVMQLQSVNSPASTHQYQLSCAGQLDKSLQTESHSGQRATQFSSNPMSQVVRQVEGLQNQFNSSIPLTSQPLPDQIRVSALMQQVSRPPR